MVWASPHGTQPHGGRGNALVLSALEIIAHFDPLMWVIENRKYGTPYRSRRGWRGLRRPGSRCGAWQDGRHLRAAQWGPRLMEESRKLLYSVPAALRDEIPQQSLRSG